MYDLVKYFEKDNLNIFNQIENIWEKDKSYYTVADQSLIDFLQKNHTPFLSRITTEDNFELSEALRSKIDAISTELSLNKEVKGDIEKLLTKLYLTNPSKNLNISKSSEGEFIIYISSNGIYKNLLIDEDGDIEILVIPQDKSKTYNKRFFKEDGLNFSKVVSLFNEVR